ncbi:MAG: PfkB family carbohydrate kinase [Chitinophagales bacterium]|nr:PfkB family carbohydrate kinase [Chitinophagales bacterium]MDW8393675.1 PfkB family carbohydrate kinase [Chitinophagales bacterium]
MPAVRPFVVAVAGLDPSGGAGLAADIKTLEQCGVMGLPVCSAITFQTEDECVGVSWIPVHQILLQLEHVVRRYRPAVVKIGIIQSLEVLQELIQALQTWCPGIKVIWDPVLRASSGFVFHQELDSGRLESLLPSIHLLTPNAEEACRLARTNDAESAAAQLGQRTAVLVKSLQDGPQIYDLLHNGRESMRFPTQTLEGMNKHGSGCVLSSAIAAALAHGADLEEACRQGRAAVHRYLQSSEGLLGSFSFLSSSATP